MKSIAHYLARPGQCHYLSDQIWQLEYEVVAELNAKEYLERINQGWRKMGISLFRPQCPSCKACQQLRVLVEQFQPNRIQRRVGKANQDLVVRRGAPKITPGHVDLYVRHHNHHAEQKGWDGSSVPDAISHMMSLMTSPLPIVELSFFLEKRLVGVCYVDVLPDGLSGVYFFHDPDFRKRSLGTYMVLSVIETARELKLPYVYMGYFVKGCRSMEYKGNFRPGEVLGADLLWHEFTQ